jgi:hypothetical protein
LTLRTSILDEIPEKVRRSARESVCQDIVNLARSQAPKIVRVEADDPDELLKTYKSMVQYKTRHAGRIRIGLRKAGDTLYVWIVTTTEVAA